MQVSVMGSWHVLQAAEAEQMTRVVYFSSVNALGIFMGLKTPDYLPIDDEIPAPLRYGVDILMGAAGGAKLIWNIYKLGAQAGLKAAGPCAVGFMASVLGGDLLGRFVLGPAIGRVLGGLQGNPVDTTTGVRSTVGANSATQGSTTNRAPGETAAAVNMPAGSTASGAAGTTAGTTSGTTLGTSGTVSSGTAIGALSTINSAAGGSTTNSPSAVNSSTSASGATLPSTTGTADLLSDAFGTWSTSLRTATTDAEGAIRTQLGGLSDQVSAIRDGLVAAPNETAADARARTDRVRFQLNALRNRLQQIGPDATGTTRTQLEGLRTDLDSLYGRINELQP